MNLHDDPNLDVPERAEYRTRHFFLRGEGQLEQALACLRHVPIDPARPLEVTIGEHEESRGRDANALMWAGTLHDIERQGYIEGRRFRAEVWHEYFKKTFLPETYTPGITRKGYAKWSIDPGNERVLVGSTKMLTKRGFADYLTQIEAFGAELGVMFHANPRDVHEPLPRSRRTSQ